MPKIIKIKKAKKDETTKVEKLGDEEDEQTTAVEEFKFTDEDSEEETEHKDNHKVKKKDKTDMDIYNSEGENSYKEENSDKKSKKSKKQKKDIKAAFRYVKSKLTPRRRKKNNVQEISIKPENEGPNECWASDAAVKKTHGFRNDASSSRSSSANSKNSKVIDIEEEDDGIPVVYDAAYQGGEV